MTEPEYDAAIQYALDRLQEELSPTLTYHNLWHTREDVMPAAERLACAYRLQPRQRGLLAVAAAYHDIGFLRQYDDHEQVGVEIATELLPRFGFGPEDIACIAGCIRATRPLAQPENLLQAMLTDADLDVLGRDDFMTRGQALWAEVSAVLGLTSWESWLQEQRAFLCRHRYRTVAGRTLRDEGKRRNIVLLEEQLRQNAVSLSEETLSGNVEDH